MLAARVAQETRRAARRVKSGVPDSARSHLLGEDAHPFRDRRHSASANARRSKVARWWGAILFDEFHERHLYGDITLARALDLQEQHRPDLKLVVMSATLDAGRVAKVSRALRAADFARTHASGCRSNTSTNRSAISRSGTLRRKNSNASRVRPKAT